MMSKNSTIKKSNPEESKHSHRSLEFLEYHDVKRKLYEPYFSVFNSKFQCSDSAENTFCNIADALRRILDSQVEEDKTKYKLKVNAKQIVRDEETEIQNQLEASYLIRLLGKEQEANVWVEFQLTEGSAALYMHHFEAIKLNSCDLYLSTL